MTAAGKSAPQLLLASKSASRRRMLQAAGVPFEIVAAPFDEEAAKARLSHLPAAERAEALALGKARFVKASAEALVLGSDQVLEREDGSTLSKARSRDELAEQLRSLRGRPHRLHSAAAIAEAGETVWSATETATMHVREFTDAFLSDYLDREFEQVRWSVGGYLIEGRGAQLFRRIDGSHFAVLGMPLLPLLAFLRERGIIGA